MKNRQWFAVVAVATLSLSAQAGTIYLCKAYAGGMFWTQAHCNQHQALIERIASVPDDGLPFDQQVALGTQQYAVATAATSNASTSTSSGSTTTTRTVTSQSTGSDLKTECKALDAQIKNYDVMARQPQSGQMQDWITA